MNRGGGSCFSDQDDPLTHWHASHVTGKLGLTALCRGWSHGDEIEEEKSSRPRSSLMVEIANKVCFSEAVKLTWHDGKSPAAMLQKFLKRERMFFQIWIPAFIFLSFFEKVALKCKHKAIAEPTFFLGRPGMFAFSDMQVTQSCNYPFSPSCLYQSGREMKPLVGKGGISAHPRNSKAKLRFGCAEFGEIFPFLFLLIHYQGRAIPSLLCFSHNTKTGGHPVKLNAGRVRPGKRKYCFTQSVIGLVELLATGCCYGI